MNIPYPIKFYAGEGNESVVLNGKRVEFEFPDLEYRTIKETILEVWQTIEIDGVVGYTLESPFQGCLE